jgi:uncharacterized membrane protein YphA (DoxX/SURF4 family)
MIKLERYAKPVLRIGMGLVFLYFGYQQLTNTALWTGFVPDFALAFGFAAEKIVLINSFFELSFGVLLLLGLFTRIVSFVLALHLFVISFSLGFNDLGVRDFGLAVATLVVFLNGIDDWCLDRNWKHPKNL